MKTKKKNRFFTFCFSCIPGAGEMYMGFMRMGVSLMLLFLACIAIPVWMNWGALGVISMVVWFYSFFHTNHLASLSDEEFAQVQDEYLFGLDALSNGRDFVAKHQKWVAVGLIFTGACLLWNTFTDMAYRYLPEVVYYFMSRIGNYAPSILVAVVIIIIGVNMIIGRKEQLAALEEKEQEKHKGEV